jgi:hypothetical protein
MGYFGYEKNLVHTIDMKHQDTADTPPKPSIKAASITPVYTGIYQFYQYCA